MSETIFLRILDSDEKSEKLLERIYTLTHESIFNEIFIKKIKDFTLIDGAPFSYWIDKEILDLFEKFPSFGGGEKGARQGLTTGTRHGGESVKIIEG